MSHCTAHLPLPPGAGEPDPYVKLAVGETSAETNAVPKDRSAPRWGQSLDLELDLEKASSLELQIMDRDPAGVEDTTIASGKVDVRQLIPGWMDMELSADTGALQSLRTTARLTRLICCRRRARTDWLHNW